MTELETVCRTCGESWTPDHAAYVRGTWRACTRCRGDPGDEVPAVVLDDSRPAQGQLMSTSCQARKDTPR